MACRSSLDQEGSNPSVKSWLRGNLLGAGAFGKVNLALNRENAQLFAVKSTECSFGTEAAYFALQNEKSILQSLDSPFVVRLLGSDQSIENGKPMYNLFLEYMPGGSLADLMKNFDGRLDEHLIRAYTKGILEGIHYIHTQGIVHCDIKGKNVLVGSAGIKLADFGAAKKAGDGCTSSVIKGTPLWMAPEVVRQEEQGTASDIWSLGCTVVEMATGKAPWSKLKEVGNPFVALYHIGCSDEVPDLPAEALSNEGKDFLQKCFCRDPRERWTSSQLLQHPFITTPLPIEAPKTLPFPPEDAPSSPRSVLDRNWDCPESTIPTSSCRSLSDGAAEVPSIDEIKDKTGNGRSNSPPFPSAGKWIIVHSPKSSLHSSTPLEVFPNPITQHELTYSISCASSQQSCSANEQRFLFFVEPQQQEDLASPGPETTISADTFAIVGSRIEALSGQETSTLKEHFPILVDRPDSASLHHSMYSWIHCKGRESIK